jgi:hypothetical protein
MPRIVAIANKLAGRNSLLIFVIAEFIPAPPSKPSRPMTGYHGNEAEKRAADSSCAQYSLHGLGDTRCVRGIHTFKDIDGFPQHASLTWVRTNR